MDNSTKAGPPKEFDTQSLSSTCSSFTNDPAVSEWPYSGPRQSPQVETRAVAGIFTSLVQDPTTGHLERHLQWRAIERRLVMVWVLGFLTLAIGIFVCLAVGIMVDGYLHGGKYLKYFIQGHEQTSRIGLLVLAVNNRSFWLHFVEYCGAVPLSAQSVCSQRGWYVSGRQPSLHPAKRPAVGSGTPTAAPKWTPGNGPKVT
ncbi:hypothetical protein GGTG_03131 [Gaeumannomyces tritici R3-111a-1]|uniref:Uncharacterized protein n=1 Tax=Gaeumannomyces tritici (strain R3-111a-1) TaxID=644352 RepID=J3NPC3_GAET3|nr:hypothetical protein GGTG_03131 [Gaeumannomyces tritici R3-111a-1]EJT78028.1 hypothetical protein GGTG_03131 [Gaeumannomyces tritici R3-111a-1]